MITKAGNALAEKLMEQARQNDQTAAMYAVHYAQDDDPRNKAQFEKYSAISKAYRDMHTIACQHMHAMEAEMSAKQVAPINTKGEEAK